jgi:ribosomal protein L40E
VYQILYLLWGANQALNKRKRLNTVAACQQCGKEQPKGTNYCRKCGSNSLLAAGEFDNVQRLRRDFALKDLEQRQQRNLAIRKIQELGTHTFCVSCDVDFKDASSFCTRCDANISKQRMPGQTAFEVVRLNIQG